jgi:hypothetical protein
VGGGTIREDVPILAADGSLVGEVTTRCHRLLGRDDMAARYPDRAGGGPAGAGHHRPAVGIGRRAGNGRRLRVEKSQGISTRARGATASTKVPVKAGDEVEIFNRSGRILRTEGRPPGR